MKLRTSDPWMPAREYSRTLTGLTLNLLVRDVARALGFQREVLGATVVYSDPDFAVLRAHGAEWSLYTTTRMAIIPSRRTRQAQVSAVRASSCACMAATPTPQK